MTIRLIDGGWGNEFTEALVVDGSQLLIVCPFIKAKAIEHLLSLKPAAIQVITRFNLVDFAGIASDITALRQLLKAGASVRGVRNLHAKLYIFGNSRAMITSANLTHAALNYNHEFGLVVDDEQVIKRCRDYFDDLWTKAGKDLLLHQVDDWESTVKSHHLSGGQPDTAADLQDFGTDVSLADPLLLPLSGASRAFVKLLGSGSNRVPLSTETMEELEGGGCHWAVAYSRRPRRVKDGDVIFMGRLTNSNDIRVFGRAIGMEHKPGRDDATPADIEKRPWKEKWPHYIRVHGAEFIAGAMGDGVSLNELMDALQADAFASTQRNAARDEGNINPRHAYRQQAAVELSERGFWWLDERLQEKFGTHGRIPQSALRQLDWPDSAIALAMDNAG